MKKHLCTYLILTILLIFVGCSHKKKARGQAVVLLEAKRAEIVLTDEDKNEGLLKLRYVSPSVAHLNKSPNRTVAHFDVVDLVDDWYQKPVKKGKRISHAGFVFFEAAQQELMRDVALTLSCPRYDSDDQTLIFDVAFDSKSGVIQQKSIQGVRLYIDR